MLPHHHNPRFLRSYTTSYTAFRCKIAPRRPPRRYPAVDHAEAPTHNRRPQAATFPFTLYLWCNSPGGRTPVRINAIGEEIRPGAAVIAPDMTRITERAFIEP
jgi:hypothetical protein